MFRRTVKKREKDNSFLMFPEVTAAIPGAKTSEQAEANIQAAVSPPLDAETMRRVQEIYDTFIRSEVHSRW